MALICGIFAQKGATLRGVSELASWRAVAIAAGFIPPWVGEAGGELERSEGWATRPSTAPFDPESDSNSQRNYPMYTQLGRLSSFVQECLGVSDFLKPDGASIARWAVDTPEKECSKPKSSTNRCGFPFVKPDFVSEDRVSSAWSTGLSEC